MRKKQLKSFKDLMVWQKAVDLAALIYKLTEKFPRSELYGMTNQMRRSVISISSNIAEGFKRNHQKEKLQFYNVAYGSVAELESQIEIALKLNFLIIQEYQKLNALIVEVSKMIDALIKSINKFPKSYILNSIYFFILLYSIFYILNPVSVQAAELFFEPSSQELGIGQEFQIDLMIDPKGKSINAVAGSIILPLDLLEKVEIRDGSSILTLWVEKPVLRNGKISFVGIVPGGFIGILGPYEEARPGKILGIVLKTKNPGQGEVIMENIQVLLHDGLGTPAKFQTSNFKLQALENLEVRPIKPALDITPPESFKPEIIQHPELFEGKYFLAFSTMDKDSGISHYEVKETKGGVFSIEYLVFRRWYRAASPHLLKDQSLRSYIYVKAVDRTGNERIEVVEPRYSIKWYENWVIWIIIIIVFSIGYLVYRRWKKKYSV